MTTKLQETNIVAVKDIGHSRLELRADGLMIMYCDEDTIYEIDQVREVIAAKNEMVNGKKCPQLIIAGKYSSVSKETREFIATDEAVQSTSAEAYLIQSLAQRILGNFYLRFNAPRIPTRIFTDRKKAEDWLLQFIGD